MDLSHINSPHFDTAGRYAEGIAKKRTSLKDACK